MPGRTYALRESLRLTIRRYDGDAVMLTCAVDEGPVEVWRESVHIQPAVDDALECAAVVARAMVTWWSSAGLVGLESALADFRQLVKEW